MIGLGGMEKQAKQHKGQIKEQVWLSLAHPRHIRKEIDWDYLASFVGVGPSYLREVISRRRNGSLPLLEKIAYHLGKNAAARKRVFRLLTEVPK